MRKKSYHHQGRIGRPLPPPKPPEKKTIEQLVAQNTFQTNFLLSIDEQKKRALAKRNVAYYSDYFKSIKQHVIPASYESLNVFSKSDLRQYAMSLGVERGRNKSETIENLIKSEIGRAHV